MVQRYYFWTITCRLATCFLVSVCTAPHRVCRLRQIDIIKRLQLIKSIGRKQIVLTEDDWKEIEMFLNTTDNDFVERLQIEFPRLTQKDIKFLMLVRLRLPYESIAIIYGIEEKSVKQRLFLFKNKLGLNKRNISTREFLEDY